MKGKHHAKSIERKKVIGEKPSQDKSFVLLPFINAKVQSAFHESFKQPKKRYKYNTFEAKTQNNNKLI